MEVKCNFSFYFLLEFFLHKGVDVVSKGIKK